MSNIIRGKWKSMSTIKYIPIYFLKLIDGTEIAFCDHIETYDKFPELFIEGDFWSVDCGDDPLKIVSHFKDAADGNKLIPMQLVASVFKREIPIKDWNNPAKY
jgi:hypothetical protein